MIAPIEEPVHRERVQHEDQADQRRGELGVGVRMVETTVVMTAVRAGGVLLGVFLEGQEAGDLHELKGRGWGVPGSTPDLGTLLGLGFPIELDADFAALAIGPRGQEELVGRIGEDAGNGVDPESIAVKGGVLAVGFQLILEETGLSGQSLHQLVGRGLPLGDGAVGLAFGFAGDAVEFALGLIDTAAAGLAGRDDGIEEFLHIARGDALDIEALVAGNAPEGITLEEARFSRVDVNMTPENGYIDAALAVRDLYVRVAAEVTFGFTFTFTGTATAIAMQRSPAEP